MKRSTTWRIAMQELKPALFALFSIGLFGFGMQMGKSVVEGQCRNQNLIEMKVTPKEGTPQQVTYLCIQVAVPSK